MRNKKDTVQSEANVKPQLNICFFSVLYSRVWIRVGISPNSRRRFV